MTTCIVGDPGTGKTRLAGTWPQPLWLNAEADGNSTALPGLKQPQSIDIPLNNRAVDALKSHLSALSRCNLDGDKMIDYDGFKAGSVVIDTFDGFQDVAKYRILGNRTTMEQRDWGILETMMRPILIEMQNVPVPVVVVAHVKTVERGEGRIGRKTWSAQGGITTRMDRAFSEILHIVVNPSDGKRWAITQPFVWDGYMLLAKDRHQRLKALVNEKGFVPLADLDGYPDDTIAKAINE
jgi:hypothetical protein